MISRRLRRKFLAAAALVACAILPIEEAISAPGSSAQDDTHPLPPARIMAFIKAGAATRSSPGA